MVEEKREVLEDVGRTFKAIFMENLIRYELNEPISDHFFVIAANLNERERTELIEFLKRNVKVFAWTQYEIL